MRTLLALTLALVAGCRSAPPEPILHPTITLASGLVLQDLVVPTEGEAATDGDTLELHYEATVTGGDVFDSSFERGLPATLVVGAEGVPVYFSQGVAGMRPGGRRQMLVPPELGYGAEGIDGLVPPDATLFVLLELVSLTRDESEPAPEP